MWESSILGAIVGAVSRLAPELLRYIDRHLDRRHELAMQEVMLKFEALRPDGYKSAELAMDGAQTAAMLDALKTSWRDQFKTGRPWLDAVSILVRPGVTYALTLLYIGVVLFGSRTYGESDLALYSGVLTYWLLGRPLEKRQA